MASWIETLHQTRAGRLNAFNSVSALLFALLLVLAFLTLPDYAISNDEPVQHRYGEFIVSYYTSGFSDRSLFYFDNLYLYGGLFDVAAVLLAKVLPVDVFVIRHALCALIGIAGIVAVWATARMIAGPRAGAIAAFMLAICGPWYGSMFNHTKDIPFAAAMAGASYFLLRATRELPRPRLGDLVLFGLLMGAALGQRATGLLLAAYVLLAIMLHAPRPFALAATARFIGRSLALFVPAMALGYLVMIAAWPWAAVSLFNPLRAILAFAYFQYPIRTLLSGSVYLMADVPRAFIPIYLAIKLPLFVWLGVALAFLAAVLAPSSQRIRDREMPREVLFVAATAILPLLVQVIGRGPAFSGMRHFIFVLPPLAVLAGIGFHYALNWLEDRRRALAGIVVAVIGAWFLWTASVLVRLHPYQYLYFNEAVGGLAGAAGRYDTDYWVYVMHEAVTRLESFLDREGHPPRKYLVAVCGERLPFEHEAAARQRLKWAEDDQPADFFIAPTHMSCDNDVDGKVIVRIERMGVLIGVVKDRRALIGKDAVGSR